MIHVSLNKTQAKREEVYLIYTKVVTDITVRIVIRNVIGGVAAVVGIVVAGCGITAR